jgi:DNA-binding NarL/FixJ family response regulator
MEKIKVLLADDHQIFRDGIISMFTEVPDMEVCCVASNCDELLSAFKDRNPDVVLLDLSMPGISGLEIIPELKTIKPDARILVLSMHTNEYYIYKSVIAGVNGYLPKQNTNRTELIKAIRTICAGESFYHESILPIVERINSDKQNIVSEASINDFKLLTNREKEILKLVVEGYINQEIAKKLFIHIRTVETHKTNIMVKLNLKNTVELVKYAIKNNLLEIDKL